MPHRARLRIAIVTHLDQAGAKDIASAINPREAHLMHGVREADYAEVLTDLLSLHVVEQCDGGRIYLTPDGIAAVQS